MKPIILICFLLVMNVTSAAKEGSLTGKEAAIAVAATHQKKGVVALKLGSLELAEQEFSLAITSNPDDPELYYDRADVRYRLAKYREAIDDFDRYLEGVPEDGLVIFLRGLSKTLIKPEDVAGACADFKISETLGQKLESVTGLDKYCAGQEGWI